MIPGTARGSSSLGLSSLSSEPCLIKELPAPPCLVKELPAFDIGCPLDIVCIEIP